MLTVISSQDGLEHISLNQHSVFYIEHSLLQGNNHWVNELIEKKGTPKYIFQDQFSYLEMDFKNNYCLPLFAEHSSLLFPKQTVVDPDTMYAFNFMINRKTVNRHLCMKFVELFCLKDYVHTWRGLDKDFDMSDVILEIETLAHQNPFTTHERSTLLAPVSMISKRFFEKVDPVGPHVTHHLGSIFGIWERALADMFYKSAISLITETGSSCFQKATMFTEKTIYSVLGLSLPIWVGGYQQANHWKKLGFDVFDDVINHDYQNYQTLVERCYYAFALNIDLLLDKNKACKIRHNCLTRLIKNRDLMQNGQISLSVDALIADFPTDLQPIVKKIRRETASIPFC